MRIVLYISLAKSEIFIGNNEMKHYVYKVLIFLQFTYPQISL